MKRYSSIIFFVLAAFVLTLTAQQKDETIVVSMVIGDVKIKQDNGSKWQKAKPGLVLKDTAVLQTGKAAKVKLLFREGNSEILIPENKTLKISDIIAKRESLRNDKNKLLLNKIRLKLYKDSSKDDLDSPAAVAGVRGADVSEQSNSTNTRPDEMFWDQ